MTTDRKARLVVRIMLCLGVKSFYVPNHAPTVGYVTFDDGEDAFVSIDRSGWPREA